MSKGTVKTLPNEGDVVEAIYEVENKTRREDALTLLSLFEDATGQPPKLWGKDIIGYGMYHYKSDRSQQEGDWPLVAFSPRKQGLTLYVMVSGFDYSDMFQQLGKHTTSKACLYVQKLSDVDTNILKRLVQRSYEDAKSSLGAQK